VVFLTALSLIFAYAVFQSGGIMAADWDRCMVALGLLALLYFRFTSKEKLAPSPEWWFRWPPLLLLGFIALQLVPLPVSLLRIVSPPRAALLQSLDQVLPGTSSAAISVFPPATLAHLLRIAAYIVVFVMARELAWRTISRRWLIVAPIVIIAGAEAVFGILQYEPLPLSAAHGTYASRNHFAGLLELALPFAAVYPIATMTTRRAMPFRQAVLASASVALAALMMLGIILSLSRMGFVASLSSLFVVGSLVLGLRASGSRRFATLTVVAAVVIAGFLYLAPDPLISRFGEIGGTGDVTPDTRMLVWKDTWSLAADYPLVGCGLGAFEQAFPRYRTSLPQVAVDSAHNDYLQFLVELGGIGFAIAAVGMAGTFMSAARAIFRSIDSATQHLAIACVAALVAILIHSFTDLNLYIPGNAMLLAWIAGVVASLSFSPQGSFTT
jgi:O-antigen ligase/polysaccharide polymerase Wzy-like membrane protein